MRFTTQLLGLALLMPLFSNAQCTDLFISEYLEGWSNNKAIEIYNPTDAAVDLGDYRLERYSNGATAAQDNQKVDLSGTLDANSVVVVVLDKQDPDGVDFEAPVWDELAEAADLWVCPVYADNNTMYFNGNDAMVLRKISTNSAIDIFGKIGEDPGETGWAEMTQNHSLVRKEAVTQGDTDALNDFLVVDEWNGTLWSSDSLNYTLDLVFANLGSHTCNCGTTGVNELNNSSDFELFPNPSSGDFAWLRSDKEVQEVAVYSLAGQRLIQQQLNGQKVSQLSLNNAPSGIYLVEVTFENGTRSTQRFFLK
ncbi:MAG: T9SS type A sorting domain-containing protein [Crocinitomicaceae bacterium]|jgi:hypothetical protein|nr:T9SS type A sorting domain-containing protein [Crocinitomicaceae bacterium]